MSPRIPSPPQAALPPVSDVHWWDRIAPSSMPWFLERFSLHDSALYDLSIGTMCQAFAEVGFDLHWNPSVPGGFESLWIRFDMPYRMISTQGGWNQNTLAGATSSVLSLEEREALRESGAFDRNAFQHSGTSHGFTFPPDDQTLTRSSFELVNWGKVEVLHAGPVRFAVTDAAGSVVDVASLNAEPRSAQ
jgi:hypothetical protein